MLGTELKRERLNAATTATYERHGGRASQELRRRNVHRALSAPEQRGRKRVRNGDRGGCADRVRPRLRYCCHLRVGVFCHEAAALARSSAHPRATSGSSGTLERADPRQRKSSSTGMTVEQHLAAGIPCAFLVGGPLQRIRRAPVGLRRVPLAEPRALRACVPPSARSSAPPRGARPALLELQVFGTALIEATQAGCEAVGTRRRAGRAASGAACAAGGRRTVLSAAPARRIEV